jgi:hypothetical protein
MPLALRDFKGRNCKQAYTEEKHTGISHPAFQNGKSARKNNPRPNDYWRESTLKSGILNIGVQKAR